MLEWWIRTSSRLAHVEVDGVRKEPNKGVVYQPVELDSNCLYCPADHIGRRDFWETYKDTTNTVMLTFEDAGGKSQRGFNESQSLIDTIQLYLGIWHEEQKRSYEGERCHAEDIAAGCA